MSKDILDKTMDKLTEHKSKFIQVNPYIYDCYNGLDAADSKLVHILFGGILKNKIYETSKNRGRVEKEERRIYTNLDMSLERILSHYNPVKYSDGKSIANDSSNYRKKLKDLDKKNIFYCWDYISVAMYIYEREIRSWIHYNPLGCVVPKTLSKIVNVAVDMMNAMEILKNDDYKNKGSMKKVVRSHLENSFGDFINRMKDKMNPIVSLNLPSWDPLGWKNIFEYLKVLKKALSKLSPKDGLIEDESFVKNLPPDTREKLIKEREAEINRMNVSTIEKELTPDDPNLRKIRSKRIIDKSKRPNTNDMDGELGPLAQACTFDGDIDPFEDANVFTHYYRFLLKGANAKVQLNNFGSETEYAGQIMDMLMEKGKKNKMFLDSWIMNYIKHSLKGKKIYSGKFTSMKSFKDSFEKYDRLYYVPK